MSNREQRRKQNAVVSKTERERLKQKEMRKRERKAWWEMYKMKVIIVLCVIIGIGGVIGIAVGVSQVDNDGGTSTGQYQLIDLGSNGCIPCEQLRPVISTLKTKYSGEISVNFYDVNSSSKGAQLANKYNVSTIPTLIFLENGKVVKRMVGYHSQSEIESVFRSLGWI